jgi:selenocysteine lyase/cysteine desulfurase
MDYMDALYVHHAPDAADAPTERAAAVRDLMRGQETRLLQPLLDYLADHPAVELIGKTDAERRAPTVAFTVRAQSSDALAGQLAAEGLGVGAGDFYAYRLIEALGLDNADGVVRASFVHYTAPEEVDRLIGALDVLLP